MPKAKARPKRSRQQRNQESNARKKEREMQIRNALLSHLQDAGFNIESTDMIHLHPANYRQPGVCLPYIWEVKGDYSLPSRSLSELNQRDRDNLLSALETGNLYAISNLNPTTYGYRTAAIKSEKDLVAEWSWEVEFEKDSEEEQEDYVDIESLDGDDREAEETGSRELVDQYREHLATGNSLGATLGEGIDTEDLEELAKVFGLT
ncbi:hypothetical protein BJ508DRAFT_379521 [Ascobolus immersus RN42]|uniref:Uncharacterized protein n=1 Tax=Ascobolus immersus RN42 TaxID=1160509 RepID=A0A3N4HV01_ASCIM|nr:hypothetical protein BJ508DRAFT_379521 [Ascobolus immersus RN42]